MEWIKLPDYDNGKQIVHEVKCPVCNTHITYISDIPKSCYVCGEETDNEDLR